jgi:hypothetical protein
VTDQEGDQEEDDQALREDGENYFLITKKKNMEYCHFLK